MLPVYGDDVGMWAFAYFLFILCKNNALIIIIIM